VSAPGIVSTTGTSDTGVYFPGADSISLATAGTQRFLISSGGDVSIASGTLANTRLYVLNSATQINSTAINANSQNIASTNGSYSSFGISISATTNISSGVTNSGSVRGLNVSSLRNSSFSTDAGTLSAMRGIEMQYGHSTANTGITPTTNQAIGILISPYAGPGTITDAYDIYLASRAFGTGTFTNHYSIYQVQSDAKNWFAGNVGIGASRANPSTTLDVNGTVTSTGLDVNSDSIRVRTAKTPASPTDTGSAGQICWDSNNLYVCTSTNNWKSVSYGFPTKTIGFFTAHHNNPPTNNYATLDTRNDILVLDFDSATEESAHFVGIIDESRTLANGITVIIYWTADTATSGNVRWGVQFEKTGTDLDSNSFDTNAQVTSAANATSGVESVASISITTIDSLSGGDRYRLRVYRVAADATNDTMAGDAQLVAVEVRAN
jgi:hypothetical protein